MPPPWLTLIADVSLLLACLCALIVLIDVFAHPQRMAIMNVVWPITPLYLGPVGLWAYFALGRKDSKDAPCGDKVEEESTGKDKKEPDCNHCGVRGLRLVRRVFPAPLRQPAGTVAGYGRRGRRAHSAGPRRAD